MPKKETLNGPCGLRIELDAGEIYPDDPGAGTPAIVIDRDGNTATFWCASCTGEIDDRQIPPAGLDWIGAKEDYVNEWVESYSASISGGS